MILNVIHRLLSSRGKTGAVGTDRFLLYKIFSIKHTSFFVYVSAKITAIHRYR